MFKRCLKVKTKKKALTLFVEDIRFALVVDFSSFSLTQHEVETILFLGLLNYVVVSSPSNSI